MYIYMYAYILHIFMYICIYIIYIHIINENKFSKITSVIFQLSTNFLPYVFI